MADIELVIKIPEDDLDAIKYLKAKGWASRHELLILKGTPLPKGHGRLIDENDLSLMTVHMIEGVLVCDAQTIIEADKETESVKEPCDDYDVSYCKQRDCVECGYNTGNN